MASPAATTGRFLSFLALLCLAAGCATTPPARVRRQTDIEYTRAGGEPLRLDLYTPENAAGLLPVLVWIHGGSWRWGHKGYCSVAHLATNGFAVVSIDYRLTGVAKFPAQLDDCRAAVRWVREHGAAYGLDGNRIAAYGASAGGHLAALVGLTGGPPNGTNTARVQAVCAYYPPTDLDQLVTARWARRATWASVGKLLGGPLDHNRDRAAVASPMRYVHAGAPPFFFMHSTDDWLVPMAQSEQLHTALQRVGVESTHVPVPGNRHGIDAPRRSRRRLWNSSAGTCGWARRR